MNRVILSLILLLFSSVAQAQTVSGDRFRLNTGPCVTRSGSGTPEGAVTGNVCDIFIRTDGALSTTIYIKTSGTGNTGWEPVKSAAGTPGTVTSVGASLTGATFTGPVTTSGTLAGTWDSADAKKFLASPTAGAGVPTFRIIDAADIPTLNQNTTGYAASLAVGSQSAGDLFYATGATAITRLAKGASGDVLVSDGSVPSWSKTTGITGVGTLTSGTTGAGFTVKLSVATITGTLDDARLSANVPLLNAANVFTANQTVSKASAKIVINDTADQDPMLAFQSGGAAAGDIQSYLGNLYITAIPTKEIYFRPNSVLALTLASTGAATFAADVTIASTKALYLEGGTDYYLNVSSSVLQYRSAADQRWLIAGAEKMRLASAGVTVAVPVDVDTAGATSYYGLKAGGDRYGLLSLSDVLGGSDHNTILYTAANKSIKFYPGGSLALTLAPTTLAATFAGPVSNVINTADVVALSVRNSSATGYGVSIIGGSATRYALQITDYTTTPAVFSVLGTGETTILGKMALGAPYVPNAQLEITTASGEILRTTFASSYEYYHSVFGNYSATPASSYLAFKVNAGSVNTQAEVLRLKGDLSATFAAGVSATTGSFSGDFSVATTKFTVASATGNTVVGGTLEVGGLATITKTTEQLRLAYDGTHYASFTVNDAGGLTIAPVHAAAVWITGSLDTHGDITPNHSGTFALGSSAYKWSTLDVLEIRAALMSVKETIVAGGGSLLVALGDGLTAAIGDGAGDTTLTVKGNALTNGTFVVLQKPTQFEVMKITSTAGGSAGVYTYTVERDKDGTGRNAWAIGDGVVSLGAAADDGWVEHYATDAGSTTRADSIDGLGYGPSTLYMTRTGTTWNNYAARAKVGNLNGHYGYSTNLYGLAAGNYDVGGSFITVDPTNGVRMLSRIAGPSDVTRFQLAADGSGSLATNAISWTTAGVMSIGGATGWVVSANRIADVAGVVGFDNTVTGGDDIRIWAGDSTPASAEFRVTEAGALTATSATITGEVNATSGYFGDVTNHVHVTSGGISVGTTGAIWGNQDTYNKNSTAGFFLGYSSSAYKFSVGAGGTGRRLTWDGTDLEIASDTVSIDHHGIIVATKSGSAFDYDYAYKFNPGTYVAGAQFGLFAAATTTGPKYRYLGIQNATTDDDGYVQTYIEAKNADAGPTVGRAQILLSAYANSVSDSTTIQFTADNVNVVGTLSLAANNLTMTGTIASTGSRVTKIWADDITLTNNISMPGLSITAGKTLTVSNTLTLQATDSSTLNIGTGGTLGTAAYTASGDYATAAHNHSGVYEPHSDRLTDIAALTATNNYVVVGNGSTWTTTTLPTSFPGASLSSGSCTGGNVVNSWTADGNGLASGFGCTSLATVPAFVALTHQTTQTDQRVSSLEQRIADLEAQVSRLLAILDNKR